MKRAIPWIIAVVALIAFGVSFFQLHKARERYASLASYRERNHLHFQVREFIIRAQLADANRPIVILGDSITEMARLPETIDGNPVINAGIGGTTVEDFLTLAPSLLQNSNAPLIAIALGTNNSGSNTIRQNYADLLSMLKKFSPRLLAIGVTPQVNADAINAELKAAAESEGVPFIEQPLPEGSLLPDHIHLNAAGYRKWTPALIAAISGRIS